jgi:hypothetical protein
VKSISTSKKLINSVVGSDTRTLTKDEELVSFQGVFKQVSGNYLGILSFRKITILQEKTQPNGANNECSAKSQTQETRKKQR